MTLAEFKTQLNYEGKLENDTDAIAKLPNIIREAAIVLAQSHPELLSLKSLGMTLLLGDGFYTLANALSIDRINYFTTTGMSWELPERDNIVGPAPVEGRPKCYVVNRDFSVLDQLQIELSPGAGIIASDSIIIWYKEIPTIAADGDLIPLAWYPFLMREVLARLATYRSEQNEAQQAQIYKAGAQQALQVEVSNDAESKAASN